MTADELDLVLEVSEGGLERARDVVLGRFEEGRPSRPQQAQEELGAEEGDPEAVAGDGVLMGAIPAGDESLTAEAAQVIGHLAWRVLVEGQAEEPGDVLAQVTVSEAVLDVVEGAQAVEESHDTAVTEAKGRGLPLDSMVVR